MAEHESTRTLVKSAPELWAECSDAASLARHLGAFGEIRITRLEPETTVAWEGAAASGTVKLEPSGWGTRVTLTMVKQAVVAEQEPPGVYLPDEPDADEDPSGGVLTRWRLRWRRRPESSAVPLTVDVAPSPATDDVAVAGGDALVAALDSLGRAHHRPYSRS